MKKFVVWTCVVLTAAKVFAAESAGSPEKGREAPKLTIDWGKPQPIDRGDYPRLRVLADGRYALVYSQLRPVPGAGRALYALIRYSTDRGATWSAAEQVIAPPVVKDRDGTELSVNAANSELTQLSPKHPKNPGRLEHYLLLSGQFAKTRPHEKRPIISWTTWPVWAMRKDEVGPAGELTSFRDPTCPLGDANPICWSSLTALGGDEVMAVLCNQSHGYDSTITLVRGRVRETAAMAHKVLPFVLDENSSTRRKM